MGAVSLERANGAAESDLNKDLFHLLARHRPGFCVFSADNGTQCADEAGSDGLVERVNKITEER
jgi:hypothetical protein